MARALGIDTGPASIPSTGAATILDFTLTANKNITSPIASPTPGLFLIVFLRQNGTGGWTVTWSSAFREAPTGFATLANTVSVANFISQTDPADGVVRWWPFALPTSNKT